MIKIDVEAAPGSSYANINVVDETSSPWEDTFILMPFSGYQNQYQGSAESILELHGYDLSQPSPYPQCINQPLTDNCQYPSLGPQTFKDWKVIPPGGTQYVGAHTLNYREFNVISQRNGPNTPYLNISDPLPLVIDGSCMSFFGCNHWTDASGNNGENLSGTGT